MNPDVIAISERLRDELAAPVVPLVGLVRDLDFDAYNAWDAASVSRLKLLDRSPAHMAAHIEGEDEDTDAKAFGRACHSAILEPDLFPTFYVRGPCDDKRVKEWREFAVTVPAFVEALKPSVYDRVLRVRDAVYRHPAAASALSRATDFELSGAWIDEESGALCKMRVDAVAPSRGMSIEVKTCRDASITAFSRAIYNLKYYWQGAHYRAGLLALTEEAYTTHLIIAVENDAEPHAVNAFTIRDDAMQAGDEELRPLKKLYAECQKSRSWPQVSREYALEYQDISLPPWAWKQIDERKSA